MANKIDRDLLDVLKFELEFIEGGGYGRSVRTPWKRTSIFLDSLSCPNFDDERRTIPCRDCLLTQFVPLKDRSEDSPCHRIPLSASGETVEGFEQTGDQDGMEEAVKNWLRTTIRRLELEHAQTSSIPPPPAPRRVLIVDDDELVLMSLERLLEDAGFETTTAWSGEDGTGWLKTKPFDLVLLDDILPEPGPCAEDLMRLIQRLEVQPLVIIMQALPLPGAFRHFSELGACGLVGKWSLRCEIVEAVRTCLDPAPLLRVGPEPHIVHQPAPG